MASKEARRNAYAYCMLQDRRQARYDRHAHANGLSMQAFLVVKRLVADGYAVAQPVPGDRRSSIVSMTEEGCIWAHDMIRRITRAEDEAMAMLAPEEQAQLVRLTQRFTDNLLSLIDDEGLDQEGGG